MDRPTSITGSTDPQAFKNWVESLPPPPFPIWLEVPDLDHLNQITDYLHSAPNLISIIPAQYADQSRYLVGPGGMYISEIHPLTDFSTLPPARGIALTESLNIEPVINISQALYSRCLFYQTPDNISDSDPRFDSWLFITGLPTSSSSLWSEVLTAARLSEKAVSEGLL